ncbi:carbohydrate binding protein with CBM6 domain [Mucilaginibacter gracilis]|uniref:Carbohydrate binding protein with CBM6 domain n=1 Tax=Mucilaginibacter gracilis TaxID=423350 RepID=A0A495IYG5_9SPHI|nr:family 43 glycosylhydrolase [Mucilaginibacter gracilis]RKR81756.1 carbohydrate binding protein with CBM6 domain [Mucilaginibacter gracilis]
MKNIKKVSFVLLVSALVSLTKAHSQNPVIQTIYTADPAPMVYKDTVFLYTGHDEDKSTWFVMKDWHIFSTTDMLNWTDRGSPLSVSTFKWAEKDAWAGQCIYRNGKFYWYVPVNAKGLGMSIGVAVSDSPTGPFVDALGKPLVSGGWGYIDPTVFIDDDGQAYLYWGNPNLYYVRLNNDMLSYDEHLGIVKVPLTDEGFKLRVINAKHTFAWAKSIDGLAAHTVKNPADNKYYWYVSAIEKNTGKKVIGVAVGSQATGPFTDVLGKPFITEHCGEGNINPTVITDNEKQPYLTWGNQELWQAKLNIDMVSYDQNTGIIPVPAEKKDWFVSKIKGTVNSTEKRFTTYEEGPWVYKRKNLYYLFYPAGGVPEHLAYSTSKSLQKPDWKYGDTVMSVIRKGGAFTNHPGVIDYKGKTYLFYHNGALPGGGGFDRSVCIDELNFDANGSVKRIAPTSGLSQGVGTINPFNRVEAETISWEQGVRTATLKDTGIIVTSINPGDYIKVQQVNFKKPTSTFSANIKPISGGQIEIHLDSADGELMGICEVQKNIGEGRWNTVTCKVTPVTGIHNLYFVFKGKGEKLFDFDWWLFK